MTTDMKKEMWEAMASSPNVMVSLVGKYQHAEPMRAQLDKHANGDLVAAI